MVGILIALPGTQLERRLQREGRLVDQSWGENFGRTNFVTKLDEVLLLEGYARLLAEIYSPEAFYERALRMLALCPVEPNRFHFDFWYALSCTLRSVWRQGVRARHRGVYWRFMLRALLATPRRMPRAVGFSVNAEHMIRYTDEEVLPRLRRGIDEARRAPAVPRASAPPPEEREVAVTLRLPRVAAGGKKTN
jgi:hypothetical protein